MIREKIVKKNTNFSKNRVNSVVFYGKMYAKVEKVKKVFIW